MSDTIRTTLVERLRQNSIYAANGSLLDEAANALDAKDEEIARLREALAERS